MEIKFDLSDEDENIESIEWIIYEQRWKNALRDFTEHLRKKYKYEDPKGSAKEKTAKLEELEEVTNKFFELLDEYDVKMDWE